MIANGLENMVGAEMLSVNDLARLLNIGREAARRLMEITPGVVTLPPLRGKGVNVTRRMPRAVFDAMLIRRSKKH